MSAALPIFTNSEVKTYKRCREEWRLAYGQQIRPVRRGFALAFGSLVHEGLEGWFLTEGSLSAALAAMARYQAEELDAFDRARAEAMLIGYDARWRDLHGPNGKYRTVSAEERFKLLNGSHVFSGMIDALVRDEHGRVWIVEHKTAGVDISPGAFYWQKLSIDDQISAYYAGARSLGHDVEGVIYDVLGKPGQKRLKATPPDKRKYKKKTGELYASQREHDETPTEFRDRILTDISEKPTEYFQRSIVVRFAEEEEQAQADRLKIISEIQGVDVTVQQPRTPESCIRYGRLCPYAEFCLGHLSPYDLDPRFRRAETKHEELSKNEHAQEHQPRKEAATV